MSEIDLNSCTLYLDSTADPSWPSPFGKSSMIWYVLAGLAVTPDTDHRAHSEIKRILSKYIPEEERKKWPPEQYELHYHDIIRGNDIFSHLADIERKNLSDEVFDLIVGLKPTLFATVINKKKLREEYGTRAYSPRSLALRATIHHFSMYLNTNQQLGFVILDEEEYRKDKEMQQMAHEFRTDGVILRGWGYQPVYEDRLERILNSIMFTPSHMSPGIQLADACSRVTWYEYEYGESNRFAQLTSLWNRDDKRIYEPSVIPK